jgi:uncharacterized protein (DUF697 family)
MKSKKLTDVLFIFGVCLLVGGILSGIVLGFVLGDNGFNLVVSIITWLLSVITASGFITVSNSLSEVAQNKQKDEEILQMIIDKVKEENNSN